MLSKKYNPEAQVLQLVVEPAQVLHVLSQFSQTELTSKVPSGHVETQDVPYSNKLPVQDAHVLVVVDHVAQGDTQSVHTFEIGVSSESHVLTQVLDLR